MILIKYLAILTLFTALLFSCGKDNKTSTPAPTPVVDTQSLGATNILAPYDSSFENVESTTNNRRLPNLNGRYFRIKSQRRNNRRTRVQAQVVSGVSFSGDKALQLFDAQNQVLVFPIDTSRKGKPLNLIPGARYKVSAKIKLPRGNRLSSINATFTAINFADDERVGRESFEKSYHWPQSGEWLEVSQEFEMPSLTQKGQFQLSFNGSADVIIDNLELYRIR